MTRTWCLFGWSRSCCSLHINHGQPLLWRKLLKSSVNPQFGTSVGVVCCDCICCQNSPASATAEMSTAKMTRSRILFNRLRITAWVVDYSILWVFNALEAYLLLSNRHIVWARTDGRTVALTDYPIQGLDLERTRGTLLMAEGLWKKQSAKSLECFWLVIFGFWSSSSAWLILYFWMTYI